MSEWHRVGDLSLFAERAMVPVRIGERRLLLYRTEGQIFASDRRCTHQGGDLSRGYLTGRTIECPIHQGRFDLITGAALNAPASEPLRTYPVRILEGQVEVEIS